MPGPSGFDAVAVSMSDAAPGMKFGAGRRNRYLAALGAAFVFEVTEPTFEMSDPVNVNVTTRMLIAAAASCFGSPRRRRQIPSQQSPRPIRLPRMP